MNNNNTISKILFCFFFLSSICCFAQNSQFNSQRAEEDYSYLKDSTDLKFRDAIKYIALNKKRSSYLSMGGSIRTTYDNYENEFWVPNRDLHYYSQRVAFHTNWQFGKNFRAFGELQSGIVTGDPIILYSDDIDVHQAFVEYKTSSKKLALRLGRQEMEYGSGRLYSLRQGPNIRQTFDMGRVLWKEEDLNLNVFYGNAVQINFDAFDNPSYIFKRDSLAQRVWGVYSQFKILPSKDEFNTELYYLGFNNEGSSRFSDVTGEETRHTIGLRKFGTIGQRITHNHELIYQFGKIGGSDISAFNLEVMWQYQMINTKWKPAIALKIDWSSGDSEAGDGKINSFNPLFVNPSLYGLAGINTPINVLSFHPSINLFPFKRAMVQLEYAFFYRTSIADAVYLPPSILVQPANDTISDKAIGQTVGFIFFYTINKNFNFMLRSTYFRSGSFITKSGLSDSVFQISPQLSFTF